MEVKKKYSAVGIFVAIVFLSLFIFFLKKGEGEIMARSKNKLTQSALEEHVLDWLTNQLEQMRDAVDMLEKDDSVHPKHKELMMLGMAEQVRDLLELLRPLHHEEECLVEWAKNFVLEHPFIDSEL